MPEGLAFDGDGNLYISAGLSQRVFRLNAADQTIDTVAGERTASQFSGDGKPAIDAFLDYPVGLAFDQGGNLLITDAINGRIRLIRSPVP